jgi:hypothetical protein
MLCAKRTKRKDLLPQKTIDEVYAHYEEHSQTISDKKANGKRILTSTTSRLFEQYRQKKKSNLSLSKFRKLRPAHILPVGHHRFRTCLCEVCLNMTYKARVLHSLGAEFNDKNDLLNATLCPKGDKDYHDPDCLMRKCEICGVHKVEEIVNSLVPDLQVRSVKWKHWETTVPAPNVKRKAQLEKCGTISDFLEEMKEELEPFAFHILAATWQQKQQRLLADNMPNNWVLTLQDFAENYRHVCQDEVASAYFNYTQSALLTSVSLYKCPKCNEHVQESTVFLSDDLLHDAHLVRTANDLQHQKWKEANLNFEKQVFFSDGCSSQFKSKIPFFLLDVGSERAFFGSQHGKSVCDSLGGVVKQAATRHVASGEQIIASTQDLFKFCTEYLVLDPACTPTTHKKRNFIFIEKKDVKRTKIPENLVSVLGTRKFHQVVKTGENTIRTRTLACYCENCLSGIGSCVNSEFTGPWKEFSLVKESEKGVKAKGKQKKSASNPVKTKGKQKKNASNPVKAQGKQKKNASNPVTVDQLNEIRSKLLNSKGKPQRTIAEKLKFENVTAPPLSMLTCKAIADRTAQELIPDDTDHLEGFQFPVVVRGDGNCLPRCGSLVAYLKEDNHEEIRIRIAVEMICNKESYLDEAYLSRGLTDNQKLAPATVALYSSQFHGEKLTKATIRKIYDKEISEVLHSNTYMGLWQLFALSSVLKRSIVCIYPKRGNPNVRRDMHRIILPRQQEYSLPVGIMWSSTRDDMSTEHWIPNHFCLLLPANIPRYCFFFFFFFEILHS